MADPSNSPAKPLSLKQHVFVMAYLGDPDCKGNASAAALKAGYSAKTAYSIGQENLKKPEIQRVIAQFREEVSQLAITNVQARLETIDDLKRRYLQVIAERAEQYGKTNEAPGVGTGLLVRQERIIGSGENAEKVIAFKIDDCVREAIQRLDEQAAKELGQWSDKLNITHTISKESAQQLADEFGLDPLEVLAEAESILRLNRIQS